MRTFQYGRGVEPGSVRAQFPAVPPTSPQPFEGIFDDLEQIILPGLSHWQHPNFFGYFPSNGELSSVLGDYLSTGLGVLGLSWISSPALTELEEVVTDWMRQMLGLSDAWSGVIQDTASSCTLVALLCAGARLELFPGTWRIAGGRAASDRLCFESQSQFCGKSRPAGRVWARQPALDCGR